MGFLDRFAGSSRDRFAAEVRRIAQRAPGAVGAVYDRDKFAVAVRYTDRRDPVWIFLSNLYAECDGASRAERRERIDRAVRIMSTPDDTNTWESVRAKLRPVLRGVTFGQVGVDGMVPPISRPAMPHLRELVVVDSPESMAYVVPARLEAWGVTVDEVFATARANLADLGRLPPADWPSKTLLQMIDTGDGYYTSLLLLPGWLAEVSERMGGPAIAFVPDSTNVMLADVAAAGALYEIAEKEYGEAVRRLSPVGYVSDARGGVVPYAPPVGHPDHITARRAEVLLAVAEYGAQTQWLTRQFRAAGIDVVVGGLVGVAKPGAPAVTVATWTDGVTTLLPEAQYIAFGRDGGTGPRVPWPDVAELVDLVPEPLLAPARYRVGNWPPPAVMDQLRARAVE